MKKGRKDAIGMGAHIIRFLAGIDASNSSNVPERNVIEVVRIAVVTDQMSLWGHFTGGPFLIIGTACF